MTLNMAASQRVEGIFGVLKKERFVGKRFPLVKVKLELEKRMEDMVLESRL